MSLTEEDPGVFQTGIFKVEEPVGLEGIQYFLFSFFVYYL